MIQLTLAEERKFQQAETCHICDEYLGEDRVRDHYHILGHFRGAAHNKCNLKYRIKPDSWKLPVMFHNLRGYDGHLIVKVLKKQHGKTRVIANNMENNILSWSAWVFGFVSICKYAARGFGEDALS